MKRILKTILTYILAAIALQIVSIHYYSMYQILYPMFKMGCINIAYNLILKYLFKSADNDRLIRQRFNSWFYYILFIVVVSYFIEYTTTFYSHKALTESLISSSKAGIPSVQIYGWRCSGTYYAESKCDLEFQNSEWSDKGIGYTEPTTFYKGLISGEMFFYGSSGSSLKGDLFSGYFFSCSVRHAKDVKYYIKDQKWDGPQPIHNPNEYCRY
jgi:hypothetical protein